MELGNNGSIRGAAQGITTKKGHPAEGPVLFVEPRKLLRQCFEECFRLSSLSDQFVAISDLAAWFRVADDHPAPSAVFIYLPLTANVPSKIEETMSAFAERGSVPPIIVISDREDPTHVLDALDAGAKGYVPSSMSLEVAIEAMRLVVAGGTYVPASALLASRDMPKGNGSEPQHSPHAMFTDRQFAVIERLREGKANKIIAYELNMRESTVKVHIRNIMRKLRATNRTQVAYLYQSMLAENGTNGDGYATRRTGSEG